MKKVKEAQYDRKIDGVDDKTPAFFNFRHDTTSLMAAAQGATAVLGAQEAQTGKASPLFAEKNRLFVFYNSWGMNTIKNMLQNSLIFLCSSLRF